MRFYIVDAFTDQLFGGNPAGVVILEEGASFPDDAVMIKTAAELRYSETAFVKQLSETEFQIRYFTPAAEVPLCGHATIASFTALRDAGLVKDGGSYRLQAPAGSLAVELPDGFVMMEMAAPTLIGRIDEPDAVRSLYQVMGLDYEPASVQTGAGVTELPVLIVSTGLPDIMLPVKDEKTLSAIAPDFPALAKLSEEYDVVGVHAFALAHKDTEITAHCRNFAPLYEIDEEAATGTSNGALTYYLYHLGLISDGARCCFLQGEAMDRPSKIYSCAQTEPVPEKSTGQLTEKTAGQPTEKTAEKTAVTITVGGPGVILARGTIDL